MRKKILTILVLMLILIAPLTFLIKEGKSADPVWIKGYKYRVSFYVETNVEAGSNYQIKVIAVNSSGTSSGDIVYCGSTTPPLQTDFDDFTFAGSDATTELYHYKQEYNTGENATFWVKITGDLALARQLTYMYWGNSTCASKSDYANTFIDELTDAVFASDMALYNYDNLCTNSSLEDPTYENDAYSDMNGYRTTPWGFENWVAGDGDYLMDDTTYHSGGYSARFNATTVDWYMIHIISNTDYIPVTVGEQYTVTFWAKTSGIHADYGICAGVQFFDSGYGGLGYSGGTYWLGGTTQDWTKIACSWVAPTSAAYIDVYAMAYTNGTWWIDDIMLNRTGVRDYSGYDNHIGFDGTSQTYEPESWGISSGKYGDAINFTASRTDAVKQRIIDDDNTTYTPTSYTWSAWVDVTKDSWGGGEEWATICAKSYFWEEYWFAVFSDLTGHARFDDNNAVTYSSDTITKDQWDLITACWNGTYVDWYINGDFDESDAYSGTIDHHSGSSTFFGTPVSGYHMEGAVDNMFILNGTITSTQAGYIYDEMADVVIKEGSITIRKYASTDPSKTWGQTQSAYRYIRLYYHTGGSFYTNGTIYSNETDYYCWLWDMINFTAAPDAEYLFAYYYYVWGTEEYIYDSAIWWQVNGTVTLHAYFTANPYPDWTTYGFTDNKYGTSVTFYSRWIDDVYVSGAIFGHNATGTFVNNTWASTTEWSNASVTLTSKGDKIQYQWWANNSYNNWNTTGLQTMGVHGYNITFTIDDGGYLLINGTEYQTYTNFTDQDLNTAFDSYAVTNPHYNFVEFDINGDAYREPNVMVTLDDDYDVEAEFVLGGASVLNNTGLILVGIAILFIGIPVIVILVTRRRRKR